MRVAICFSGIPSTLNKTHTSLRKTFDVWFGEGNYDIFVFMPPSKYAGYVKKYFPEAEVKIKPDEYIEDKKVVAAIPFNAQDKYPYLIISEKGFQQYLQQIHGYKQVNQMRIEKEMREGFQYDFIVRARMDLQFIFYNPLLEKSTQNKLVKCIQRVFWRCIFTSYPHSKKDSSHITTLLYTDAAKHTLYIPDCYQNGGYNDNFCIGPPYLMDVYMNVLDIYFQDATKCYHAESFLKYCLDMHNIDVTLVNILYQKLKVAKIFGFMKIKSVNGGGLSLRDSIRERLEERIGFCPYPLKESEERIGTKLHRFITETIPFYWKRCQKRSMIGNIKAIIRVLKKRML